MFNQIRFRCVAPPPRIPRTCGGVPTKFPDRVSRPGLPTGFSKRSYKYHIYSALAIVCANSTRNVGFPLFKGIEASPSRPEETRGCPKGKRRPEALALGGRPMDTKGCPKGKRRVPTRIITYCCIWFKVMRPNRAGFARKAHCMVGRSATRPAWLRSRLARRCRHLQVRCTVARTGCCEAALCCAHWCASIGCAAARRAGEAGSAGPQFGLRPTWFYPGNLCASTSAHSFGVVF